VIRDQRERERERERERDRREREREGVVSLELARRRNEIHKLLEEYRILLCL